MIRKMILLVLATTCLTGISNKAFGTSEPNIGQARAAVKTLITSGKLIEAADAYQKLLKDFSNNAQISAAVFDIAETYRNTSKFEQSLVSYKDVLENWPQSSEAMRAQSGIVISDIALNKLDDANDELVKLKTDYATDPNIAQMVFNVGDAYYWFKKYSDSNEVYKYVIGTYPKSEFAMWATMGLAISCIAGKDEVSADNYIAKLSADYAESGKLAEAFVYVAGRYEYARSYEKAGILYQHIADEFPQSTQARNIPFELAKINVLEIIESESEKAIEIIDNFTYDFNSRSDLPGVLLTPVSERLYVKAFVMDGNNLKEQAKLYFQKAAGLWELLEQKDPNLAHTADGYNWAGYCYLKLSQYQKAIDCFDSALQKYPKNSLTWHTLIMLAKCYEDFKKAGGIANEEADVKIKEAYQKISGDFPKCKAAGIAISWLEENGIITNTNSFITGSN